jgi:hypothetical protein
LLSEDLASDLVSAFLRLADVALFVFDWLFELFERTAGAFDSVLVDTDLLLDSFEFDEGVETDLLDEGVETDLLDEGVETDLLDEGVETDLLDEGVETDLLDEGVETDLLDEGLADLFEGVDTDLSGEDDLLVVVLVLLSLTLLFVTVVDLLSEFEFPDERSADLLITSGWFSANLASPFLLSSGRE